MCVALIWLRVKLCPTGPHCTGAVFEYVDVNTKGHSETGWLWTKQDLIGSILCLSDQQVCDLHVDALFWTYQSKDTC